MKIKFNELCVYIVSSMAPGAVTAGHSCAVVIYMSRGEHCRVDALDAICCDDIYMVKPMRLDSVTQLPTRCRQASRVDNISTEETDC